MKCRNGDVDFGYPIFDVNACYDGIKNCHSQGGCKIDDIDNIFNIFFFIALHNFRGTPPSGGSRTCPHTLRAHARTFVWYPPFIIFDKIHHKMHKNDAKKCSFGPGIGLFSTKIMIKL